ncbi:MAG TPA: nuclear transport factor 2 family protein [Bacteroidales bacterium]|nr:nuclear transport factor 2 family protein [Bacteroidales bacterium]HRX96487.1 nuclear transport factor 2 family protein [Bacteroidales bacterium]
MTPAELIKIWVELFNKGNAEAIAELYHPDAINHQVANDPVIGRKNICKMFATEFGTADMTCIIENIFQDGEWGILEWKDPLGLRGCGFFHVVVGKIKFQRGYWDKLSFLKMHGLPLPTK